MNLSLFNNTATLEQITIAGFEKIRCNLTGRVIAEMSFEILEDAVNYMRSEDPFASDDKILDAMQLRWIVNCSRPAPHLVSFTSHGAIQYLVQHHPRDLFALLVGRMLFDHEKIQKEMSVVDSQRAKLFWLTELQDSQEFQDFNDDYRKAMDTLVRIDAMHSVRKAFYSDKIRKIAAGIREQAYDTTLILSFIEEVESHGLVALTKRTTPPEGNQQSLQAALAQHGLLPYQMRIKENEAKQKSNAMAFAMKVLKDKTETDLARLAAGRVEKHSVVLDDLTGQIHASLKTKYESALAAEAMAKANAKNPKAAKPKTTRTSSKSVMKSSARFGDFDFSFGLSEAKL